MDRIDDERVRFYLRHRDLIETWAAVRKDVRQAAHEFYMSLADDLGQTAAGFGDDIAVWSNEGNWSKVGLYRPAWDGEGEPVVQVCFEWNKDATFADGVRFIGVRVNYGSPEGKAFRPYAGDALRDLRDSSGFARKSNHWPAYQLAPSADGEFWDDLSGYRDRLLDTVESAWNALSSPVGEAVVAWRSSQE